ncbi:MAG: peroxiredoxin [Deltaproteobacteria bacterium]|nr:MAG: peroxiredoxin [Deltaproteobacteria bacterium]RLC12488.1 MAG: peroxiredoxin [Deltaproteobacteria bacterium]
MICREFAKKVDTNSWVLTKKAGFLSTISAKGNGGFDMADKLGIFVSTEENWDHLLGIARAAVAKGKELIIFFTHRGTLLCKRPDFEELAKAVEGRGKMSLCLVSWNAHNLGEDHTVPGIPEKDFATQARHGELIEEMDRYLVL